MQGFSLDIILSHVKLKKKPKTRRSQKFQTCKNLLSHLVTNLLFSHKSKYYEIIDQKISGHLNGILLDKNETWNENLVFKLRKLVKNMMKIVCEDIFSEENCKNLSHSAKNWNKIAALNLVGCISVEVFYNSKGVSASKLREDASFKFALYVSEAIAGHICTHFKHFFELIGGWQTLIEHEHLILNKDVKNAKRSNSTTDGLNKSWLMNKCEEDKGYDYTKPVLSCMLIAASLGLLGAIITLKRN